MQILGNQIDARDYGVGESVQFDIVQSAEMFNLLSNGLYKDKITAVIRELSTNAYDSHVEAGRVSTPFEVKLPNPSSPNFSIRDFGTGMSQDKLTRLYTSYGKSNRNESNDFIGGMGLGSKAPFCYTDAFVVTSFYNGTKYIYTAAKDEDGKPNLIHLMTEATAEPNGVEISLAVKQSDFAEFNRKAVEVYKWFKTTPKMTGGVDRYAKIEKQVYVSSGANNDGFWGITGTGESRVIMGNIGYKIDPIHFSDNPSKYSRWLDQSANIEVKLLQIGMDLEFPVGAVSIDAGREGLQYTKNVIKAIKDRLKSVSDLIKADIEKQIAGAKTLWNARIAYSKLYNVSGLRDIMNALNITWNGQDVKKHIDLNTLSKLVSIKAIGRYRNTRNDVWYIQPEEKVGFLINDMDKGGFTASQRYRDAKNLNCVYLVRFHTESEKWDAATNTSVKTQIDTKDSRKQLVALLGIDDSEFVNTSSLPKPPRQKGGKRETQFEMDLSQNSNYKATEIDFEDGGVYAELNHGFYIAKSGPAKNTVHSLYNQLKAAEALGIKLPKFLYLVKTVSLKKYQKSDDWMDVSDYIKQEMAKLTAGPTIAKIIADSSFQNTNEYEQLIEVLRNSKVKLPANQDGTAHELQQFADEVVRLAKNEEKVRDSYNKYRQVAYFFGMDLIDAAPGQTMANRFDALKKKYQMLDFLELMRYNYVKSKASLFVEFLLK